MSQPTTASVRARAFFVTSDEALYFGGPRAQVAGEAHHGETLFPPMPTSFQGAVRTRLLHDLRVDLSPGAELKARVEAAVGPPLKLKEGWSIDGPWVAGVVDQGGALTTEVWVPAPLCAAKLADIVYRGPSDLRAPPPEGATLRWLGAGRPPDLLLDDGAPPQLPIGPAGAEEPAGWLRDADLLELLTSGNLRRAPRSHPPFVAPETRVGLALDGESRTAKAAMLYFRQTRRFSGVPAGDGSPRYAAGGFAATLRSDTALPARAGGGDVLSGGTLALGRRSRPLAVRPLPAFSEAWRQIVGGGHLPSPSVEDYPDGVEAWMILASPVFLDGSPQLGSPTAPVVAALYDCRVEVLAAVLGAPIVVGGLDATTGAPKPNRPFLPAGSAWRIRVTGPTPAARHGALLALHHQTTLGAAGDRSFGCGRTWITAPLRSHV